MRAPSDAPSARKDLVELAALALCAGRPVVLVDDVTSSGVSHLVFAAGRSTPSLLAFVVRHSSGFVGTALPETDANRLRLPPMSALCEARGEAAAFAVAVDAASGISTGISAADRAQTIRTLADPATEPADLRRPGHVVPLRARAGGLRERIGVAEAGSELARISGLRPVAGLAAIVSVEEPAQMAGRSEVRRFCDRHRLTLVPLTTLLPARPDL